MIRVHGNGRCGFTLIELLVVIAMIMIITGAMTTSVAAAMKRAKIQKATSDVNSLTQAILSYENHDTDHEIPPMTDTKATVDSLKFFIGKAQKEGTKMPALIQAALGSDGVMRDPWGKEYTITIYEYDPDVPAFGGNLNMRYFLPNFYNLTEDERK